ncbi:EamA family transporter [Rhodoferax lacus]|uniref:EamA family transporter n=1 Tax=Rhodoferax lacus TaxID=2184758 RepID=A0A3E1RDK1_9BURK|nr:DMT family transporter [Rhodoferax lacus]RFO97448.1 EamA family transporter [Rhodoferax lacus]
MPIPFSNPVRLPVLLLAALAMLAFAANSLLCRLALRSGSVDAATFTAVRLLSGAMVLALVVRLRSGGFSRSGDWSSACALFVYAAGFSWAYLQLTAATGALLLFGTVQVTMIAWGLWRGERLRAMQWLGLLAACAGLVAMLLPGLAAPPLLGCLLMLCAGAAWGVYSLRGRGQGDATAVTAGNFWRASVLGLLALLPAWFSPGALHAEPTGWLLALASGALASGLGYAIWYTALRGLNASSAASIQLTVPALAALGAALLLGEPPSLRLALASLVILGGVALVIAGKRRAVP